MAVKAAAKKTNSKTSRFSKGRDEAPRAGLLFDSFLERLRSTLVQAAAVGDKRPAAQICVSAFPSPWLFLCDHTVRLKAFIRWFEEQVKLPAGTSKRYFASELQIPATLNSLVEDLYYPSLFTSTSLAVIYGAETLKVAQVDALTKEGKAKLSSSVLILGGSTSTKKETVERIEKVGTVIALTEFNEEQLYRWIEREAKRLGTGGVERSALSQFHKYYGNDLAAILSELEKLSLSIDPGARITPDLLKDHVLPSGDHDTFVLMRLIATKHVTQAVELCKHLIADGMHPLQLTTFLSKCYRILAARCGLDENAARTLPKELSSYYYWKDLSPIQRMFKLRELSDGLHHLSELDSRLKRSGLDGNLLAELTIQRLAQRRQMLPTPRGQWLEMEHPDICAEIPQKLVSQRALSY